MCAVETVSFLTAWANRFETVWTEFFRGTIAENTERKGVFSGLMF